MRLEGMSYNELRSLAAEKDLKQGQNPKKEELIRLLKEEMMSRNSRIVIGVVSVVSVLALACGCLWLAGTAFYAGRRTGLDRIVAAPGNTGQEIESPGNNSNEETQPKPTPEPIEEPAEEEENQQVYVEGRAYQGEDGAIQLFVLNPSAPTQEQKRHPTIYQETRVSGTPVDFIIDVPAGYVAIVGGWSIDGTDNGVYLAHGPGHYRHTVIDGFALIVQDSWAQAEWQFRLQEAEQYNWAHDHVDPGPLQ